MMKRVASPGIKGPRGRFAPTPSGRLHWGNLRSSLLAWLQIRCQGGTMVLRIEDVDRGRARDHLRDSILKDLSWLGLDWDEGPDVGGAFGPYLQSQRSDIYAAAMDRLEGYACGCSRAQLKAAKLRGEVPACRLCRERQGMEQNTQVAWRWPLPPTPPIFEDRGYGRQAPTIQDLGDDPILRGREGDYRYTFAVVVDDHEMHIDEVCRGADLLPDTPRQILLSRTLYGTTPRYFHVPLVLGPDGKKLSKSEGAPDLVQLREAGTSAGRVIAGLAQSCGLIPLDCKELSAQELLAQVDPGLLYAVSTRPDEKAQEIPAL